MTVAIPSKISQRDLRLDFWRGLCIVDMVLVHLLEQGLRSDAVIRTIVYDYLRFAAGGFVFMAGLCVGAIHLKKAIDPARRNDIYLGLLRRALFVLCVYYFSEFGYLLLCPFRAEHLDLLENLRAILTLQRGYDLLPFYVIMLALCPLFLELMRRGLWWILAIASIAAFAFGSVYPWAIGLHINQHFLPMQWQMIFILGLFGGALLPRYDRLARSAKLAIAIGSWFSVLLLLAIRDHWLGLAIPLRFDKVPLSLGELLRYMACTLAIVITTDLLWKKIEPTRLRRFVNRLGRRSLGTYVMHIWIVGWVIKISLLVPHSEIFAIAFMCIANGFLWLFAMRMDDLAAWWTQRQRWAPRMEYATLPLAIATVWVALLIVNPFVPLSEHQAADTRLAVRSDKISDVQVNPTRLSVMIAAPQ
jgi:hypothetical protein